MGRAYPRSNHAKLIPALLRLEESWSSGGLDIEFRAADGYEEFLSIVGFVGLLGRLAAAAGRALRLDVAAGPCAHVRPGVRAFGRAFSLDVAASPRSRLLARLIFGVTIRHF